MRPSARRVGALLGGVLLAALAGCAATGERADAPDARWQASIEAIAVELVQRAEDRADLRGARFEVRTPALEDELARRAGRGAVELARRVRDELEFALGRRVDVVVHAREGRGAAPFGATHAVDGRLERVAGELRLTARVIALESGLVLAPTRGRLVPGLEEAALLEPPPGPTWHHVPGTDDQHLPRPSEGDAAEAGSSGGPASTRLAGLEVAPGV